MALGPTISLMPSCCFANALCSCRRSLNGVECNPLPLSVSQVGHVRCHRRAIADLDRSIGFLARTNALDEISHVVNVFGNSGGRSAIWTIYLFRKIPNAGL